MIVGNDVGADLQTMEDDLDMIEDDLDRMEDDLDRVEDSQNSSIPLVYTRAI